jgi:choline dehydrogenase-like flavoprotein
MIVRQEGRLCACSSPSLSVFSCQVVSPVCQWIRFLQWTTASTLVVATSRACGRSHPLWAHTDPGYQWWHPAGCCPLLVPLARQRAVLAAGGRTRRHRAFRRRSKTSVLDLDRKAHDLNNLYLADSSFFPTIGAVNPTRTIIANALRIAIGFRNG